MTGAPARVAVAGALFALVGWFSSPPALALNVALTSSAAPVYVAGRQIHFDRLGSVAGEPVAAVADPGLRDLLDALGAKMTWQPGTRFVAVTRADGKIVTLTVGSYAMTVDGAATELPLAPFYRGADLYVPLRPMVQALGLDARQFRGGYVFVPHILSVSRKIGLARTIVQIDAAVPIAWHAAFNARRRTLTLSFPGFSADASEVPLGKRDAVQAIVRQSGPPGFPTATVAIQLSAGTKFAAHRMGSGVGVDVVLAKNEAALRLKEAASPKPIVAAPANAAARFTSESAPTPSAASPVPTAQPIEVSPAPLLSAPLTPAPLPSAPRSSAIVGPSPQPAKITSVQVNDLSSATRITLTLTGSVSFEWHRLDQPDNRYWIDIHGATLVGPAQNLASKLPFITDMQITQHQVTPEAIVRVAITPSQPIDVQVGPVEGSLDQLGIEIENAPPPSDAPRAGVGSIAIAGTPSPRVSAAATQPDLIAIDPGHGGNDPGAINSGYGLVEKQLTLQLSRAVKARLERLGWRVVMTRDGDNEVGDPSGDDRQELQARCDVANAAGARFFVSIHMNSWVSSALSGTTTYYWRRSDRAFAQAVETATVASGGLANDGVQRDDLYVIKHTNMPAVLVEAAFLSNPHDAKLLEQPSFVAKLADGIAGGITNYSGGPQH